MDKEVVITFVRKEDDTIIIKKEDEDDTCVSPFISNKELILLLIEKLELKDRFFGKLLIID